MASNANLELRVVTAAKNLCSYVLTVTNKTPKSFRFTLVSRVQNLSLDIVENIYKADKFFVQSEGSRRVQKRLVLQHYALMSVKILADISLIAREQGCILPKQYE